MARKKLLAVITLTMMLGLIGAVGRAQSVSMDENARCQALAVTDFSNVVDAPTQITEARLIKDVGGLLSDLRTPSNIKAIGDIQPTCRVLGYVTPNVGFVLLLPVSHWNGKFLHVGCGGWCGSTEYEEISCAMHSDYACIGTDMGHSGGGGLWSRNNLQAQIDFSYRATHVATLAGKAILERYYKALPNKSYFMGCSTGGYQAMVEAQRYPWDFDGIIAGAPDMDEDDLAVRGVWLKRSFLGEDGKPVLSSADIQLLHRAVLAKCDMDDGIKDGIISAPYRCKFDPAELQCKAGKHDGCLSQPQVQAVKNIYGRPTTSKGEPIFSSGNVLPGSELDWAQALSNTWGDTFFKDTALLSTAGNEWKYTDFDFDRDYKRGAGMLYADTDPDLRKFKAAGGKLLSYQGDNDTVEIPGALFDYYETVEKTMGGRAATLEFYRLFAIPGMNHCGGGDGVSEFDYLSYLEAWVERGQAPDVMIGTHVNPGQSEVILKIPLDPPIPVAFTRPVYPYPSYPRYKGTGDPNDAANFVPVQ